MDSVKLAKKCYDAYLENKKKAEEEKLWMLERNNEQEEVENKSQDELTEIKSKLQQITDGLNVADDIVKQGNEWVKVMSFAENKHTQRASKSSIENRNWHEKKARTDGRSNKRMRELEDA